jgi:hypothetical protein
VRFFFERQRCPHALEWGAGKSPFFTSFTVEKMKEKSEGSKFSEVLKWVGYLTAILSLCATVVGIVKFTYNRIETRRKVDSLISAEALQLESHDYGSAWRTLEQASQLLPDSAKVHSAQGSLAMAWLDNVHLSENQKFSDITQELEPVLTRAVAACKPGQQRADLRAHIGWAYFLESRSGRSDLDPAGPYAEAVAEDHDNPYAQAMWGHWILWQNCGKISDAASHFSAALASHRQVDYVRRLQLAALLNCHDDEAASETIRVANAMRMEQRTIDSWSREQIFSLYYGFDSGIPRVVRLVNAVPPAEHLATFHWLFDTMGGDNSRSISRTFYLAVLQEAAGQRDDAIASYHLVQRQASAQSGPLWKLANLAVARLSHSP